MLEIGTKAPDFTLLADTELTCIQAYDVWKEKNMYGKRLWVLCEPPI